MTASPAMKDGREQTLTGFHIQPQVMVTALGYDPVTLAAALNSGQTALQFQENVVVMDPGSQRSGALCSAPVFGIDDESPEERLETLLWHLLGQLNEAALADVSDTLHCHLLLPRLEAPQIGHLRSRVQDGLEQWLPEGARLDCQGVSHDFASAMETCHRHLQAGGDPVLLLAMDTLLPESVWPARGEGVMNEHNAEGMAPGEAACLLWVRAPADRDAPQYRGLRRIPQPAQRDGGGREIIGALEGLFSACGTSPRQINLCLRHAAPGIFDVMDWYDVSRRFWPLQLPEAQRAAMQAGKLDAPQVGERDQPEELDLQTCLGNLGVCAMPVALCAAQGIWEVEQLLREYESAPPRSALLCDTAAPDQACAMLVEWA